MHYYTTGLFVRKIKLPRYLLPSSGYANNQPTETRRPRLWWSPLVMVSLKRSDASFSSDHIFYCQTFTELFQNVRYLKKGIKKSEPAFPVFGQYLADIHFEYEEFIALPILPAKLPPRCHFVTRFLKQKLKTVCP